MLHGRLQRDWCSSAFFFAKSHGDTRGSPSEIKNVLESYISKLANGIVEGNILFAVNFMFKTNTTVEEQRNVEKIGCTVRLFPQAPVIDSETGYRIRCESPVYLMQILRVGDSNCLTFYDSGANTHLIDGQLARLEELQLIFNKSIALGVIGGGSIRTEYGSFRFNL